MSHSTDFTNTIALIAVRVSKRKPRWTPDQCLTFAWFSVGQPGDASIDEHDLITHTATWAQVNR